MLRLWCCLAVALLFSTALAVPTSKINLVQHEKRSSIPHGWRKHERVPADFKLPMRIALAQSGLHKGYDHLMDVSHPESPNYGKHWTAKQVAEAFAPKQESVDSVMEWLKSSDIAEERIKRSQSLGWLHFDATVREAEKLLKTKYHLHKHASGQPHIACDAYHVPSHLKKHIDFITPTVHFDAKISQGDPALQKRGREVAEAAVGTPVEEKAALMITKPMNGFAPKTGVVIGMQDVVDELETCDVRTTPSCLRALYRIPTGFAANPRNSFGVTSFTPYAYSQEDLDLFFDRYSPRQRSRSPVERLIDGGIARREDAPFKYLNEPNLDLEYAMTLVNPQNVTIYQVGDFGQGASFNNFLDALDGTYCTFDGGDDPLQDAQYPSAVPGGYQGPRACGGFAATKVISTSYGYNEADLTPRYEERQCNEYLKLGLQGTTFLFSSGDYGVAGTYDQCIASTNGTTTTNNGTLPSGNSTAAVYNDGTSGKFNPAFPSTCPYITSVGATQIVAGGNVNEPEIACQNTIRSGGGFSNVFPLPAYQSRSVLRYFRGEARGGGSASIVGDGDRFNNSRATRGYPDISANGANYATAIQGKFSTLFGTSASAPVVGSIVTLINEARTSIGKGSVGFINPTLYRYPGDLNDIRSGRNPGCGTDGFEAAEGWDPVTGLGTPNYPKLLTRFLRLP